MPRLNPHARATVRLTRLWETALDDHVLALDWSARHGLIAAASVAGPVHLLDAATGQLRYTLAGHGFGATAVEWSAAHDHLASAGQDGSIRLWDVGTGQQVRQLAAGAGWVERIAWCPVNDVLASAAGKKLRLWSADGALLREFADHAKSIADVRWQPGAEVLASTCYGALSLWNLRTADPVRRFEWKGSMIAIAWSPDGKYIATGDQDATVHFWVVETGEDLEMAGYVGKVRTVCWDHTSRFLATGGGPTVIVWDCSGKGPAKTKPLELETHTAAVGALAFQHHGPILASGGEDGVLALWHPGKQQGTIAVVKLGVPVSQLRWSDDDQALAVGTADGRVMVFSAK